jgi:Ca2+-binding RTX toxin-like protein
MWGGRGNDVYIVDDRHDRVFETRGNGIDTVKASVSYSLSGTHVEKLMLTGRENLNGTGNSLDNLLAGNSGNNVLKGGRGDDTLRGMSGDDRLDGGSGHDRINGGAGDDVLKGGAGNDRLTGGSGADTFVFQKGGGRDVVTDFRHGRDDIDVSRLNGVNSLSDLDIRQEGRDTLIQHDASILVLKGVNAFDLDSNDFIF